MDGRVSSCKSPPRPGSPAGHFPRAGQAAALLLVWLTAAWPGNPASAQNRVVTIGDSWAFLVAPSLQASMNVFHPGVGVVNQSYGGGTAAGHATMLADITNRVLSAGPDVDIVWLSSGGNDMLAGALGGGWFAQLDPASRNALYDTIGHNVSVIANHILSIRPDIQVVIEGYDYVNIWDGNQGELDLIRGNLGILRTNIPLLDLIQNDDFQQSFRAMEARKSALADSSRRIHYINNFGLLNTTQGYAGYFGIWPGGFPYPPEVYPTLPTPAYMLADPIHLNATGYNILALRAESEYFATALQAGNLALTTTLLDAGTRRIGTVASTGSTTAYNNGPNFTKVEGLAFGTAGGEFSGGGQAFNPLFQDPHLGSDSVSVGFSYAPTSRGVVSQQVAVVSQNGSANLTLAGRGVGPEFQSSHAALAFGIKHQGEAGQLLFDLSNATPDGDWGSLTDLTLLEATVDGPDAALFELLGFVPGSVLSVAELISLTMLLTTPQLTGSYNATLKIVTDQGTSTGGEGQTFEIPLSVVVVPEPHAVLLAATGLAALFGRRRKRLTRAGARRASGTAPWCCVNPKHSG